MQFNLHKRIGLSAGVKGWLLVLTLLTTASCNYVTYRHHGAKQRYFARPNVLFMDGIVNYRRENKEWPASLQQFANSGKANRQLVEDFKYYNADFKVIDSNRLKIYFYNYKKESYQADVNGKVDLNALQGTMRFTKTHEGYTWKIIM